MRGREMGKRKINKEWRKRANKKNAYVSYLCGWKVSICTKYLAIKVNRPFFFLLFFYKIKIYLKLMYIV